MVTARQNLLNFVDGRWGTAGRYVIVSAINVLNHQIVLYVANSVWGWPGGWANAFAASVALVPAYFLTRTLVWSVNRSHSVRREVVPFFALALLGLVVSSGTSAVGQAIFGAGLFVNVASMIGYVGVWVAKFFVLERIFAGDQEEAPGPIGESHAGNRVSSV